MATFAQIGWPHGCLHCQDPVRSAILGQPGRGGSLAPAELYAFGPPRQQIWRGQ
jgi:hypothetical protein